MSSGREIKRPVTPEDIRKWEEGWADMMITIWRENMLRLKIFDTGALYNRMTGGRRDVNGMITISHQFMLYGIYVARGVGNGYKRGNDGGKDGGEGLYFLDKAYRKANKKGKPRKRRDWFANPYLKSVYVLSVVERDLYGNAYMGTLSNVVDAMFGGGEKTAINKTISRF